MFADHSARIDALYPGPRQRAGIWMKIPVWGSVLHRNHDRVGSKQCWNVAGDRFNLMCLHRKDDDILRAGGGVVVGRLDGRNGFLAAVGGHQPNTAVTKRLEVRSARDEGHVLSGQCKPNPDVAANRTDTDNRYLQ